MMRGDDPGGRRQEDDQRDLGRDGIGVRLGVFDDLEQALRPVHPRLGLDDHRLRDLIGQVGGALVIVPAWTRIVRIRVTSLAVTRVFAASSVGRQVGDVQVAERLLEDRCGRDDLGVRSGPAGPTRAAWRRRC